MNADKERELTALFNSYDSNGDGVISADELRQAFEKLGQSISEEEIGNMMKQADVDGNGRIDLTEFLKMMAKSMA